MSLKKSIVHILEHWQSESKKDFKGNQLATYIRNDFRKNVESVVSSLKLTDIAVKASAGAGNWADIPWLSILDTSITLSTEDGYYPVYLFKSDGSGAYLSLAFGVTKTTRELGKHKAQLIFSEYSAGLKKQHTQLNKWPDGALDLKANTKLGKSYETATIAHKYYDSESLPSDADFENDLKELLQIYQQSKTTWFNLKTKSSSPLITSSTSEKLTLQSIDASFVASSLAKPFTILTGASGTGKTKQAESLAKYFSNADGSNSEVVAVGADWTDNRSTLGFVNHLNKNEDGKAIYQSTQILNLMLRADLNSGFPYFLILDEMNLSHVERYFADFLSVMEQKEGKFQLHDEGDSLHNSSSGEAEVPSTLKYPDNLFVIGTVNIDETTYMFSPKVLDRANVIEFKVDRTEMEAFLAQPAGYPETETAEAGQAEAFLQLAKNARADEIDSLPNEVSVPLNTDLMQLFDLMQAGRYEFAYRTAKEINRYMRVCYDLTEDKAEWIKSLSIEVRNSAIEIAEAESSEAFKNWETNFDEQIVQKILPKLHGSIGRVGKLIAQLANFCHSPSEKPDDSLKPIAELVFKEAKYQKSFAKLQSMASTLREEQFVSFIH